MNTRNGTSGWVARDSIIENAASSTAPPSSVRIVTAEPHDRVSVLTMP